MFSICTINFISCVAVSVHVVTSNEITRVHSCVSAHNAFLFLSSNKAIEIESYLYSAIHNFTLHTTEFACFENH